MSDAPQGAAAAPRPNVTFYDTPPARRWPLLARLAEAAQRKGRRMLILCADPARAAALDRFLWTYRDDSFLAHAIAAPGRPLQDEDGRLVIVTAPFAPTQPEVLVQDTPSDPAFAETFPHVIDLVDHSSPEALAASRERFRAWRARAVEPRVVKTNG